LGLGFEKGGADGLRAVGAGWRPAEFNEVVQVGVLTDVLEEDVIFAILDAQDLHVLEAFEGGDCFLEDALVEAGLDDGLLVGDFFTKMANVEGS